LVAVFAVGWIWGGIALARRRPPGERFWQWLTVAQVVAGIQALVGIVLLLMGFRPSTWLHLVYGFGPLAILAVAHLMSREVTKGRAGSDGTWSQPWVIFTAAGFICFGLSLRALTTGLGG
jgi:heme A synthase